MFLNEMILACLLQNAEDRLFQTGQFLAILLER